MRNSRAFTLLEVLVVLAIIGGLMAVVTISSGNRQAQDETDQYARQLMALFSAYRQEAVFQNIDLGLAMNEQAILLLSYQDIHSQEFTANRTREELDQLAKNPWQPYSGPLKAELEAPDNVFMTLTVDGSEVDFGDLLDNDSGPLPALLFLSSDEYTPFELLLVHDQDRHFEIRLRGDGFSAPMMLLERFDE